MIFGEHFKHVKLSYFHARSKTKKYYFFWATLMYTYIEGENYFFSKLSTLSVKFSEFEFCQKTVQARKLKFNIKVQFSNKKLCVKFKMFNYNCSSVP